MSLKESLIFDKRQTNIAKGVAILLLLWHHLFYNDPENYQLFTSLWMPHSVPIECYLADFCKVCVSIFLFLSGYGLFKSMQKSQNEIKNSGNKPSVKHQLLFIKKHLLKVMMDYWFVFILFVPIGIFFNRPFWVVYEKNPLFAIIDSIGLYDVFKTPTMNVTWWYMGLLIILYLLFPIINKMISYSPETTVVISVLMAVFPYSSSIPFIGKFFIWFPAFTLGMYFAHSNGFKRIQDRNSTFIKQIILCVLCIILTAYLRRTLGNQLLIDAVFSISIILFSFFVLSRITVIGSVLEYFGKHSGLIFMFHTFLYLYYFKDFVYWFNYSPLIYIVFTILCLGIAVVIELLKKLTFYNKLSEKIIGK